MKVEYEVVPMEKVPSPPVSRGNGERAAAYEKIRALGTDEKEALRIPVKNARDVAYWRTQLRKLAERDGRRLLTSRNQENTVLWAWTVKKGSK